MATSNVFGGQVIARGGLYSSVIVTALSDGNATLTGAQLVGGLFTITPGADRTLTLENAQLVRAALPQDFAVGDALTFTICNNAAGGGTTGAIVAVAAGITDGTAGGAQLAVEGSLAGGAAASNSGAGTFMLRCTNAGVYAPSTNTYTLAAFTLYRVG